MLEDATTDRQRISVVTSKPSGVAAKYNADLGFRKVDCGTTHWHMGESLSMNSKYSMGQWGEETGKGKGKGQKKKKRT